MKAHIETINGKVTLKVYYDPALCNWDEAIAAGLASFGLKQGQAAILAFPFPHPGGIGKPKTRRFCFLQEKNNGAGSGHPTTGVMQANYLTR